MVTRKKKITLKKFLARLDSAKRALEVRESARLEKIYEHQAYKGIPGTSQSYRQDAANTNTKTEKHAHVYAKLNGDGKQLYAVNVGGSGHDGSSGTEIPKKHADHFRSLGYDIPETNILETLNSSQVQRELHEVFILPG
jgi:hypothetical protein